MARYNAVNIDDFYFTKDGTISGKPCRLSVVGLDALKLTKTGKTNIDAEGNAYVFLVPTASHTISIEIEYMREAQFEELFSLFQDSIDDEEVLTVSVSGDTGDFDFQALPRFPKPITFSGKFSNGMIEGITINLQTTNN